MFCFEILKIFGEKLQKRKNWKSRYFGLLRCNVGNPRRGVDLRQGVDASPRKGRGAKMAPLGYATA